MTIDLIPEDGPPPSANTIPSELPPRVSAASKTVELLVHHGLEVNMSEEDKELAEEVVTIFAESPEAAAKAVPQKRMAKMTPPALRAIDGMLREFSHAVVDSSVQVRHYVTNKLIEETANPDPRVRIKALELLGKISDVGLFTDKREVTVTHQTAEDLRESLRAKLSKLVDVTPVEDAEVIEEPVPDPDDLLAIWDKSDD